ncbi:hypothetical protein T02_7566 [Trichinella nativa]|uniref:Uncharacterized protein n=1 Tax=Trichinella nativa TaxID=6335 RepID=A0A0V1L8K7_9BILA|nr:hypothetical protein T06_3668 [Trichinella sp. T6]KRZ55856.1 hypothetical protein T02_7566 [Trichinella nativa]
MLRNFESGENVTFRFQTTTTCQFGIVNDGASDNSADSGQQCRKNSRRCACTVAGGRRSGGGDLDARRRLWTQKI